jgi:hypothetical protein
VFKEQRKEWTDLKKEYADYSGEEDGWLHDIGTERDSSDLIKFLFQHEFGEDIANWPPNMFKLVGKGTSPFSISREMEKEGWIWIGNYNQDSIFMHKTEMMQLCNRLIEFFKWAETLPTIDSLRKSGFRVPHL